MEYERVETSDGIVHREVDDDGTIANLGVEVDGRVMSYGEFINSQVPRQAEFRPTRDARATPPATTPDRVLLWRSVAAASTAGVIVGTVLTHLWR